ncbi:Protein transport protein SEC20 [Vanrija pseudolonga]|uniref:Protein transport protein SEC20 n=1 Tax=Vanrija pseudolonga TaxID=143232 RepID=A0AAF1BLU0_9TREE|nr:Protein transport protein SEC20 [Vanrija pseudolonga]
MPPIPPQALDPTAALAALSRTLSDVRGYQLPRLRSAKSAALARDLASEARADLASVQRGLEDAREAVEGLSAARRDGALLAYNELEREYDETTAEFRAALVESKRAVAAFARRHELLEPDEAPRAQPTASVGGDDALQTKTNEVTDALRRTTQLLQAELERSVLSTQMLDESTRTIKSTHGLYDNYAALLTTSTQLVRALERADWWDRALIFGALAFFLLCVGYVLKSRVLNRVGGAAAWWVGGSFRLIRAGLGGGSAKRVKDVAEVATGAAAKGAAAAVAAGAAASAAAAGGGVSSLPHDDDREKVHDDAVGAADADTDASTARDPVAAIIDSVGSGAPRDEL